MRTAREKDQRRTMVAAKKDGIYFFVGFAVALGMIVAVSCGAESIRKDDNAIVPTENRNMKRPKGTYGEDLVKIEIFRGQMFKVGERIAIKASIKNICERDLVVPQPQKQWNLEVLIGKTLQELSPIGIKVLARTIPPRNLMLKAGSTLEFQIKMHPEDYVLPTEPGVYFFQLVYANATGANVGGKLWAGKVRSSAVKIRFTAGP